MTQYRFQLTPGDAVAVAHATHHKGVTVMSPVNDATARMFLSLTIGTARFNLKSDGTWDASALIYPEDLQP